MMETPKQDAPALSKEAAQAALQKFGDALVHMPSYWHLIPVWIAPMFRWNTHLYQGFIQCAALDKERYPEGVVIDHSMLQASMSIAGWADRENLWEDIRKNEFPDRPSRIGAWYLFDDQKYIEQARTKYGWFNDREIFEFRVVPGSNVFRADMNLVGGNEQEWAERGRRYWSGELADDALVEVIVSGAIYVPDWDTDEFRTALQKAFQR